MEGCYQALIPIYLSCLLPIPQPPSARARPLAPSVPPRIFLMMSSSLPGTTPSCTIQSCLWGGALSSYKWVLGTPSPRLLQTV